MKLHLPYLLRRAVVRALFAAATVVTTLASSTYADMITPDGRTATQVIQSGNVYDVYTNTVRGNTGFNSFSTFDVYAETTANLHLADGTGRLINVVRDSASHIDGVLNSYKDGRIGGDVYFLNPNGIIVGKSGVINVGSISMSTPTAAFVEQLIARDGSISATATQAVLAGDMPINEKGTISIKGKVNARHTAELRAGKVEVKGGEVNTGVKFREMVNTGKRKVDTKGMSIQDGRLSFGKKPSKARRVAKAREQKPEKKTEIAIFADDVLVDGGNLNADWVYIDPDKLEFSNQAISGDYMLEARVIVLNNISVKQGETLTSFTLNAANELADGTFEGNVGITLSNSNILADEVKIFATATTNAADAVISITGCTVTAAQGDSSLGIYATSRSGNTGVDIQNSTLVAGSMEIGAMSLAGNAVLTLGSAAAVKADTVALTAGAVTGNADVNVQGKVTGGNDVTITATTGNVVFTEAEDIKDQVYTAEGGGNATVTVSGTMEAQGALTVSALAIGTHGDATLNLNGKLSSLHTETKSVGELGLARTDAETVKETDTPETANSKNAAFMKRYNEYLKGMPTDTAATAAMNIAATSATGNASITQAAASELQSSLSTTISADAAKAASVLLAGKVASGDISASAKGETATLRVAEGAALAAAPHQSFVREGTVVSVSKENGAISLEARSNREDRPEPAPEPQNNSGVLLEVAGSLTARREAGDRQGAGEGGAVSLASDGKLTVTETAALDASSANGKGGAISFDAPEYELQSPLGYKVNGTTGLGTIHLVNHEGLTGETINNADTISSDFIKRVLNLSYANGDAPREWTSGFTLVKLSGDIVLTKDVEASIQTAAIADGTRIDGRGKYSLTLTNSAWHNAHLGCSVTIGNNVSITGVTGFTFKFRNHAVADSLMSTYFGGPTSLTVGENFTVHSSGNVAITMEGLYNTYVKFGKGVDIQAGGDVTISAKTTNGMGTSLLTSTSTDLLGKVVKLIPGAEESPVGKALSKLGIVKFDSDKFFKKLLNRVLGKKWDTNQLNLPQIGVRVSKASVTFADSHAGAIKGKTVAISSSSSANVSGRKGSSNDIAGISVGYIYNDSKVDLGKDLSITATGFKEQGSGKDKKSVSVSITSSTNSKLSLENCYDSGADNCAVGVLVSVGTDFNTLNIDESVRITAPQDINIGTKSDIESAPFMSLGTGWEKLARPEGGEGYVDDPGASADNILMFGANVMVHKSTTTINGTLESTGGSIGMTSEDSISPSLTMNGSLQYTLSKAGLKKDKPDQDFLQFLGTTLRECLTLDLGIGKLKIGEDFKKLIDKDNVLGMFQKDGDYDFLQTFQDGEDTVDRCIDMSIAADIVVTDNRLIFNGTATAGGDITVEASSEIEAACGAETSIVGVPAEKAIAGAISVPVVVGDTVAEIGSKGRLTAGGDISVSSSTELPMSFDFMGWNDWAKFVKASGKSKPADFISALRGSLKFIYDYKDNGDFGVLDSLTSSHASTLMKGTGGDNATTIGGDMVVDVRNLNTKTIINDGATLTAGGEISAESSAKGTQVTFAGRLPVFLTISRPVYMSTQKAGSAFGGSVIVGEKTFNTVTYIGAATLEARQLEVDATGDAFMMEMSLAGAFGSAKHGVQGGVNVISENKMTVSEISGGAKITLSGSGEKEGSSISATDKSVLLNITGLEADGGSTAVGVGVAVTVNNAFTAAMLGNNTPIGSPYESNWKSVWSGSAMPFARAGAITLNFTGDSGLSVEAENKATLVNIGISAAVQTGGGNGTASAAANIGVDYSRTEATARQHGVNGTGNDGKNDITTQAKDTTTIVSVAGDASVNTSGKNLATGAGALSVNRAVMDTTAYVTDCTYSGVGEFTLDTSNKATAVAVDVAAGVGAAAANIAAGSAWNSLSGNTGSHLTGGSVGAESVKVASLTDLTSFSCTLGAAINIKLGSDGAGGEEIVRSLADDLDDSLSRNSSEGLEDSFHSIDNLGDNGAGNNSRIGDTLDVGEDFPILTAANGGVSFDLGASIARNAVGMGSKAVVEGCSVTTSGALEVTAEDTSVITAVSIGAAVDKGDGTAIGAGGVFSFAPVSSTTEAAIRQKKGAGSPLTISAGSLKLHATDNHRERVWSFGGGYGDTAGVGMVLSWGSFAGATTLALLENVNAMIGSSVDILASSDLDTTFISVGGSASTKHAAVTGMINYLNFNNTVLTDIKDSTLTVSSASGTVKALSSGTRAFKDFVGALGIRASGKTGAGIGGALSFVYVGGNGASDTNLTQMLVRGSTINNSGTTELLATSSTTGTLAGANAVLAGGKGITFTGSFSWFSDASFTQVDISDTYFNKRDGENDKSAKIKAEATGTSNLTLGLGSLSAQIGKGGGIGVGIGVIKDNSTTSATMQRGGVQSAGDFTLHASATSNLSGLVIGGAGSGQVGVSGGAFASTIAHNVVAEMKESIVKLKGALTIKADNHSNVGRDKGTRFTLANGALGGLGGGVGVAVSCINVEDQVVAKAHNVSVNSGSMDVLAEEYSDADAVTVNMAGGLYVGMDVDVVRPVLRGAARASVTSDLLTIAGNTPVGITTTGSLNVQAKNTQWMRSHLWAFALSVNPKASLAANICVNDMTMAGSANALIQGNMPLDVGGDMNVLADTVRTATYTTVPVSGSLGLSLTIDVNSLRVSSDTSALTNAEKENKAKAATEIDKEIDAVCNLLQSADIKLDNDTSLTVSGDVRGAMGNAAAALEKIETPKTAATVDLKGNSAAVGGNVDIKATDTITTTPTTVPVTGGILAIAPHFGKTKVESTVEAIVKDSTINATGNISVDARQTHRDDFHNVGVAVAGGSVTTAVYDWTDKPTTATSLQGNTKLTADGAVHIATHSDIKETYHHVNVGVGVFGNVAFILPTFTQTETNTLTLQDGVSIEAQNAVTIGTHSRCNVDASVYDVTLGIANAGATLTDINMGITQSLTAGSGISIQGSSVDILQDIDRKVGLTMDHISVSGLGLAFPLLATTDTVTATLSIGDDCSITARTGNLTIDSKVATQGTFAFLGVNTLGISIDQSSNKFTETVTNQTKLGKNAKLRAENGTMAVSARSTHKGDMKGSNILGNVVNVVDMLRTINQGYITSGVTIGTGFDAKGKSLTLEALNTEEFLYQGKKVSVSLLLNPFSKNAYEASGTSTATITVEGGRIDVENLAARARTDVAVKVNQLLGGGSITIDVNIGQVATDITQTAKVTLGTGSNELDILTDNTEITAHNKHLFTRLDASKSMVYGGDFGLVTGTSKGTVDSKQTLNASVTLGSGAKIRRRADADHYLKRQDYRTLVSATNNVESNTEISLFSSGVLNANCVLNTWDKTQANATLNLNGTIDAWGDTELTAYSHARHNLINTVKSVAIIPTFNSSVKNTIDTADAVNINGAVETIGNLAIQSGSACGRYKLVDGATLLPGDDDTNTTSFSWGRKDAVIHNLRTESVAINANLRAGGELAIINDSSANTVKKPFNQTKKSNDYLNAAIDTAAGVTSTISIANAAKLYAGLGSAVKMVFLGNGSGMTLQFSTAQMIFEGSTQQADGTWLAPSSILQKLADTSGNRLTVGALTLPGMAFRVETKADAGVFSGKLYSPAKHGLDLVVSAAYSGNVETRGVTLQGYETGLFLNRKAVDNAVTACAAPDLFRSEGVSIRSQAQGNLYVTGKYDFPYSTFYAESGHDIVITGDVRCGAITMNAEGDFIIDAGNKDYNFHGPLKMYSGLLDSWEREAQEKVVDHAASVVKNSGNHENKSNTGCYNAENYGKTISESDIRKAASAETGNGEGIIRVSGKVSIKARLVDLNGKIYSGYQETDYVINPGFMVLTADGKRITVDQARALYRQDSSNSMFKLDGYTGVSLAYDAANDWISLNSYLAKETGIDITGTIVNSDPTGAAGLYVSGGLKDLNINNKSAYTLNVGTVDMTVGANTGIRLANTATGIITTYKLNDKGEWVQNIGGTITNLGAATSATYSGTANYQVVLQKKTSTPISESGRLTHGGRIGSAKVGDVYNNGKIGSKDTMIDQMSVNTNGVSVVSGLTYTYSPATEANGTAKSTHSLSDKKLTRLHDPGVFYRWKYTLEYSDECTNTLYIGAANSVGIHFGGAGSASPGLNITSGNVNFSGVVTAPSCTVNAADTITAGAFARINGNTIGMTANRGSIGSAENPLVFNANTAAFSAGQDMYLVTQQDTGKLVLSAGKSLALSSEGALDDLVFRAGDAALVAAQGQINVSADSSAATTALSSETAGITVAHSAFSPGVLTAEAEGNVSISTTGALTLDYVESRQGSVALAADKGITSMRSTDLSRFYAAEGSDSTSLKQLAEKYRDELSDEYYAKLLYYERLYYERDKEGKYTHRAADGTTFILPEEKETLAELTATIKKLYDSGQGDNLSWFMMSLSGTPAVGGAKFANETEALAYLAQHPDKLETDFPRAFYDQIVSGLTAEICKLHGNAANVDYGKFNETIYRLYWLKDETGKYLNQDARGNFVSPDQVDGFGKVIGKVYSDEMCQAITRQFKNQAPGGSYDAKDSGVLANLSYAASGYLDARLQLGKLNSARTSVASGKTAGELQTAVRAKECITLTTRDDQSIGGGAFRFTVSPVAFKEDGTPVYSDWATAFRDEIRKGKRAGVQLVSENKLTGELLYAMSYFEARENTLNELEKSLLGQAIPGDIHDVGGAYRVYTRNYIAVDAPEIKASGRDVLLASNRDINLGDNNIHAANLFLSTTGSLSGSVQADNGVVSLYAGSGLGSTERYFGIGGSSTYTLGSDADVFLKVNGQVKLASLKGEHITIDTRGGSLAPALAGNEPNVIGRRIDFYGDLDGGLNFRTFGLTQDEGGLHWHGGGSSNTLRFGALNTAYTFWFVREDDATDIRNLDIGYSGHLILPELPKAETAAFRQVGSGDGRHILEFTGEQAFGRSLTFSGEGAYTVLAPQMLVLDSGGVINVGGDAILRLAGIDNAADQAVSIHSAGNMELASYNPHSPCNICDNLAIDGTGNVTLNGIFVNGEADINAAGNIFAGAVGFDKSATLAGNSIFLAAATGADELLLNGRNGITGLGVVSPRINADSSHAGVFLQANTADLSGASQRSFAAALEAMPGSGSITVHDVKASGSTARVKIRAITDELLLDGLISAAALEFYGSGDIIRSSDVRLLSDYSFMDVWKDNYAAVWDVVISSMEADLRESLVWLFETSDTYADKSTDDARELRDKANGEDEIPAAEQPRYLDRNGNTVSRDEYAKLITGK